MNIQNLKPVSELSRRSGVKALVYGPPGSGKTPIAQTAPRPVLCAIEPGLLSMRKVTNLPAWEAHEPKQIGEFLTWVFQSAEAKQFDTIVIDSVSEMAEVFLKEELARNKHGMKAYGEMSRRIMDLMSAIYYCQEKHFYLIAKQGVKDIDGVNTKYPYFPGQELNVKIPHLYDEIFHIDRVNIPGQPTPLLAFRTKSTFGTVARDRSGNLNEFEEPDLNKVFKKCIL